MKAAVEIFESNFQSEVLRASQPVLVDFWAEWCGPCKMLAPVLEELAREQTWAKVVKVDVDKNPGLAERYRIQSIPTLLYFVDGQLKDQSVGALSKSAIVARLEKLRVPAGCE